MWGILADLGMGLLNNMMAEDRQDNSQTFAGQQQEDTQGFNSAEAAAQRDWATNEAGKTREFNAQQSGEQRDWTEKMAGTAYQRTTRDLAAAGLSPLLAYSQGASHTGPGSAASSSTPSGSSASSSGIGAGIASPVTSHSIQAGLQTASQIKVNDAVEDRTRAEADKTRAEKTEVEARTPTHAVSRDQMQQQIQESIKHIEKMQQEIATGGATAANLAQQTRNLQAVLPQIEATIDNLRAHIKLMGATEGKERAETSEINQRVKANLPQLEGAVKELERQARVLAMPQREQDAAVHSSGIGGALSAAIRALTGLGSLIK